MLRFKMLYKTKFVKSQKLDLKKRDVNLLDIKKCFKIKSSKIYKTDSP